MATTATATKINHNGRNLAGNDRVLVIGLGEIGYNNAEYMTMRGLAVDGYDISCAAVSRAIDDDVIAGEAKSFAGYDCYIICISTHNPDNMFVPQYDGIIEVAGRIAREGKPGALVSIESTIPKGASSEVAAALAAGRARGEGARSEKSGSSMSLVHVPHRYYSREKANHGVNQTRVIGAVDEQSMEKGVKFYGERLGIPLHRVSSIEVAELSKVVENSYRFLEIAFAEELKMICDREGVDFAELRSAVNTKWNVKLLEAQQGIGGHCLPKDSEMFLGFARNALGSSIIDAAKTIDRTYRLHIGQQRAVSACREQQRQEETVKLAR